MSLTILTPLGALLAVGIVVPLFALRRIRRRARRARETLGVAEPARRTLLVPLSALVAGGVLLALAATQPVFAWTRDRTVRTDAEAFVVLDVSRSMLAQDSVHSPQRIERAKVVASQIRRALPDVRVGIASLTDRVLPHLFPSTDEGVFEATIERSLAIERPPPRSSFLTGATSLNALATMRGLHFFTPTSTARVVIVLTDGESDPVSNARLGGLFRRDPAIGLVFVQFWGEDEKVFSRGVPEPQYVADPSARSTLDRLAASTKGAVYSEDEVGAATRKDEGAARQRADGGRGAERRKGGAGPVPRRRRPVPVRSLPVAPRPLATVERADRRVSAPRSGNHISTASGKPLSSMYEIARLASQAHGLRARARQHGANCLVARLGPALLARPRAPEPAESERGAIDVARMLAVPVDADRPIEQRSRLVGECARILGRHEIAAVTALFRSLQEFASHLLTELELRRHRSMILHLTMATEASGSTCGWRAGLPGSSHVEQLLGLGEVR